MTPQETIQNLADNGKIISLTLKDESAIQIFDAVVNDEVRPTFQTVAYSSDLDVTVSVFCSVDLKTAREFGEYLIKIADDNEKVTKEKTSNAKSTRAKK